jgi:hypothetical protein
MVYGIEQYIMKPYIGRCPLIIQTSIWDVFYVISKIVINIFNLME